MSSAPRDHASLTRDAVAQYWGTLEQQGLKQRSGKADQGNRAAVTGGKQMNGFCRLIQQLLQDNGLSDANIHIERKLELPGYFRPTKKWDMVVVHEGRLLAALEFKSMAGSFGNNFNNRAEEAIGTGADMRLAIQNGGFGPDSRPWLGWLMLLEESDKSMRPAKLKEPHFPALPDFQGKSIAGRFEVLLRKLVKEGFFDAAALLLCTREAGQTGQYTEPVKDLAMEQLLSSLAGHIRKSL